MMRLAISFAAIEGSVFALASGTPEASPETVSTYAAMKYSRRVGREKCSSNRSKALDRAMGSRRQYSQQRDDDPIRRRDIARSLPPRYGSAAANGARLPHRRRRRRRPAAFSCFYTVRSPRPPAYGATYTAAAAICWAEELGEKRQSRLMPISFSLPTRHRRAGRWAVSRAADIVAGINRSSPITAAAR